MARFEYNEVVLDICGDDIDFVEKWENNLETIKPLEDLQHGDMSRLEMLKAFESVLGAFFNAVFGDGTWQSMFNGKKRSLTEFINCFNAVRKAVDDTTELEQAIHEFQKSDSVVKI